MRNSTSQEETAYLLVAAQLLQAIPHASSAVRKRLQKRAEELLDEADAERTERMADRPIPYTTVQSSGGPAGYQDLDVSSGPGWGEPSDHDTGNPVG